MKKKLRVLVIGKGAREHILAIMMQRSLLVEVVFCAPGNPGMSFDGISITPIKEDKMYDLLNFAIEQQIDLVIVGPEAPLVDGIVDLFEDYGIKVIGPRKKAATLEGSKVRAKKFMKKYGIRTAPFRIFKSTAAVRKFLKRYESTGILEGFPKGLPIVIKMDGLAAGKGARRCNTIEEALAFLSEIETGELGDKNRPVIVEECIFGEEVSFIALVAKDGTFYMFDAAQDYKAVWDGENGPNTGGTGANCPAPIATETVKAQVRDFIKRTISGAKKEKMDYSGFLYLGIMVDNNGDVWVLEYNVRMGDPEAQPILVRLKSDLAAILLRSLEEGNLDKYQVEVDERRAVTVVNMSEKYPGKPVVGDRIYGIEEARATGAILTFAGVTTDEEGNLKTSGGRVSSATALGSTYQDAKDAAYKASDMIKFRGKHNRLDIGYRAIRREAA